jgi:beta-glucosidase
MIKNKKLFAKMNAFYAILLVILLVLNIAANYWGQALIQAFGYTNGMTGGNTAATEGNLYFASEYNETDLRQAQHELAHEIGTEGAVLLTNQDNALPLASGASVTVFSEASTEWLINGTGSSAIGTEDYLYVDVKWSLEQAGFQVNEAVWDWYDNNGIVRGGGSATGDWSINESDWDTVTAAVGGESAYAGYQDAALVVIGRTGGEGADLATSMENFGGSAEESYLELSAEEKSILANVKEAGFKKLIVIINSANPVEMTFLNEYDVDACLLVGPTGAYGLEALGHVLAGDENPSGHLTDTQVYDVFSSAAMQNFGNTRYVDESGTAYGSRYNYVVYNEGIYVGYRYYETRYEDTVMGTANVGDFVYEDQVAFPFGYGLSYTTFEWSNYQMKEENGAITVSVDVTNTGSVAGKDVAEVYFQSPYTDYDKANNVEKASVELAAFAKTSELEPGATETLTMTFQITDMKSYDYTNAKTYIMDEGDYYVTVGSDAHAALNNILAAKGYSVDGDATMTGVYTMGAFQTLGTDEVTGTEISNQFEDASAEGANYLTRQNWAMMDGNGIAYSTGTVEIDGVTYPSHYASSELIASIDDKTWESSGRPAEADDNADIVVGQDNGLQLIDLMGIS